MIGRYGFMTKTIILPFLFSAALVSKRGTQFLKDWAIYLSLVILFDSLRGFIYALITRFELPVYQNYALDFELVLGCNNIYPAILQNCFQQFPFSGILDRFFVIIYGSHFFVFLAFGLVVWFFKYEGFKRYRFSMLSLMYCGGFFYFIIPTVPPWMAANTFQMIPPIKHISALLYNITVPSLQKALDVNPIAAMPSLHAAFPTLIFLIAFYHFKRISLLLTFYGLSVLIGIIYRGDHYLIDVLAGVLLAVIIYMLVYNLPGSKLMNSKLIGSIKKALAKQPSFEFRNLSEQMLCAMLIILLTGTIGLLTTTIKQPFRITPDFIQRELKKNPSVANTYLFSYAFHYSKFKIEVEQSKKMLETACDLSILEHLAETHSTDPEPVFWLTYFQFKMKIIDQEKVLAVIDSLYCYPEKKKVKFFQNLLRVTIEI